eukprot:TRINITY_DN1928_c0_g3_i1.p1 TRINITY_DN1928_c0_g3~~TRINITY_DN1928_c0_g3_i1.p1  ORF type:complete len:103 (+),score=24.26 TRINITY_DN1928_c0_g3_i1:1-309(+)
MFFFFFFFQAEDGIRDFCLSRGLGDVYKRQTQKRAWKKYIGQGAIAIYNLIHSNFNFFEENEKTGNSELDQLILDCVQQDPNKRPSAKEALEKVKALSLIHI